MGLNSSSDSRITSPIAELNMQAQIQESRKIHDPMKQRVQMIVYLQAIRNLGEVIETSEAQLAQQIDNRIISEYRWSAEIAVLTTLLLCGSILRRQKRSLEKRKKSMTWVKVLKYIPLTAVVMLGIHMGVYSIFQKTSGLSQDIRKFLNKHHTQLNEIIKVKIEESTKISQEYQK